MVCQTQLLSASDRVMFSRCPNDRHEAIEFRFVLFNVGDDRRTKMSIEDGDHRHARYYYARRHFNHTGMDCEPDHYSNHRAKITHLTIHRGIKVQVVSSVALKGTR